jgi:hypothetical protein
MPVLMSDELGSCPNCHSRLALTSKFCPLCQVTLLPGQVKPPPEAEPAFDGYEEKVNELSEDFFGEQDKRGETK